MNSNQGSPLKPPRGHKLGREETGILMTVIKALLSSASASERDAIKTKLEQEYKALDKNLDCLIMNKQESLTKVMQAFRQICMELDLTKEKVTNVKTSLIQCKQLLRCRREELERLWLEGVEHKYALQLLEQIDRVRNVPQQFNKALGRRQYLIACEVLMTGINSWTDDMDTIEGIRELKTELKSKRMKLYDILLEEINEEIFVKSAPSILILKRQGSGMFSPFQRSSSDRQSSGRNKMNQIKVRKLYLDVSSASNKNIGDGDGDVDEILSTAVKCISQLKLIQKLKEDMKQQLDGKLVSAMNSLSQQILDYTDTQPLMVPPIGTVREDTSAEGSHPLMDFLKLTFEHFRTIVAYHLQIIALIQAKDHIPNQVPFTKNDVWYHIQSVLQSSLKLYFDLTDNKEVGSTSALRDNSDPSSFDINTYFMKKKPARPKKNALFKFAYSLHGLTPNGDATDKAREKHGFLVCSPHPQNILLIYNFVEVFVSEIEADLGGVKCDLRKFMSLCVNRVFVQQIYKDISEAFEVSKRNLESWKDVISVDESKQLKAPRLLLQGVAMIGRSILDTQALVKDIPSHAEPLLRILDTVLSKYADACESTYNTLTQNGDRKFLSGSILADDDIVQLLKSLPNWSHLEQCMTKQSEAFDESPEDIIARNSKEADLFVSLFGGKKVAAPDIVNDGRILEQLARFHESLEWLSFNLESLISLVQTFQETESLNRLMKNVSLHGTRFREVCSNSLLLIYVEIRVHVFHFLGPLAPKVDFAPGIDSQVADTEVLQLTKDLLDTDSLLSSLQPIKARYLFDGLGQLISTLIIRGANEIRRINDNGVKRICRDIFQIEQTLGGITKCPPVALDQARQFYEIFLHSIQDLFDLILEKGPQFREIEYMYAIQLLYRSKPGISKEPMNDYLSRLSNILGDIGVTV